MTLDPRSTQREYEAYFYREKNKGKTPMPKEDYDQERLERGKFRSDGTYVGIEWTQRLGLPKYLKEFYNPETGRLDLEAIQIRISTVQKIIDTFPMKRNKRFSLRKRIREIKNYIENEVDHIGRLKTFIG
ncbi:hypothetical protein [Leptospira bandrabouensis]|uniref:hypothetical protein n=1 Tax=Leptospira bandrabouensis TaxID=2484903 RepID=UPI001090FAD6|nr:hypothetical protein [Leptospira bandrabouensis]TGN08587.1 hypothetical protein EHR07_03460 [Leptospira bandrabouensis]